MNLNDKEDSFKIVPRNTLLLFPYQCSLPVVQSPLLTEYCYILRGLLRIVVATECWCFVSPHNSHDSFFAWFSLQTAPFRRVKLLCSLVVAQSDCSNDRYTS